MVGQNRAALIAQIGAWSTPKITEGKSIDIAGAVDAWNKGRQLKEQREKEQLNNERRDAYINAINGGNQEEIDKAFANYDPEAYARVMASRQDADTQFARQKELADLAFERQKSLKNIELGNQKALALFKAQNGIGTNGLVNINMNPLDKKRIETIGKKMDENIMASQARLDDYNRMEQLLENPNVKTGGLRGIAQDALPDAMLNPETVELRSIIKKIVPQMRPAGSGTTSDRDMKIFEQATVGLGKDKDANLNIVRGRKLVDENNIAKEELRYQWLSEGGNLGEFDKAWRKYLEANPIFASEDGKLNASRRNAYEWFTNPQSAPVQNNAQSQDVTEGTVIEDANGNRMILRGGQWQKM